MAQVNWRLGRTSLVDVATIVLAAVSVVALLRLRLNSAWLALVGAVAGLLSRAVHYGL
jgi:chromate transporter